jgi:metal-dependent amidase/aminoacylase/carboxypeptidase family protein
VGLADLVEELGITLSVIGTPAEEGGGGKILLQERGVFDEIDAAMMIHPGPVNSALAEPFAVSHLRVRYVGRASHAAAYPDEGVNAADAFVIAQAAIGLLRQHLPDSVRIHGVVTKGGEAPNIIPDLTEGRWYVRASTLTELDVIEPKVKQCFNAGAVATGCSVEIDYESPRYSEFRNDLDLLECFVSNSNLLGRRFETVSHGGQMNRASTDMANISLSIPAIHPYLSIDSLPVTNHQRQFADLCISPAANKTVIDGAIAMAWTVVDLALTEALRSRLLP